jgi:hypothetical protein
MTSIASAIKQARSEVQLVPFGRQYRVDTWSEKHRSWWQGHLTDYRTARAAASGAVVALALQILGVDRWEALSLSERFAEGRVEARVRAALQVAA